MAQGLLTLKLFDAILYNRISEMQELLMKGARIDSVDENGQTCLHLAACKKQDVVDVLLEHLVKTTSSSKCKDIIDQKDNLQNKALTYAIESNNLAYVKRLVAAGATTSQDELFLAVKEKRLNCVKYFVTVAKVSVNCHDAKGNTPLTYAVLNGSKPIIQFLLEMGADVNSVRNEGTLPLINALIYMFERNVDDDELELNMLLELGAKVSDLNADGYFDTIVDRLLKWGADVNKSNDVGDTLLIYFARLGNLPAVRKLLKLNADINVMNNNGVSALVAAIEAGFNDIINILIKEGANINPVNGKLPLICAVEKGNLNLVKYLVDRRTSVNRVDNYGNSPLLAAVKTDNEKIVEWLLENGAHYSIHSVFLEAVKRGNLEIIEMLIKKGAKVNFQYKNGSTPLQTAIDAKHGDVVKALLTHGADINLEAKIAEIPVLSFRRLLETDFTGVNFNKVVKMFIDKGADVNITINGFSWLTKYAQLDDYKMVRYLVSKGADINQTSDPQNSPLVIAAKNSNWQMFECLVNNGGDIGQVKEELDKMAKEDDNFAVLLEELSSNQRNVK